MEAIHIGAGNNVTKAHSIGRGLAESLGGHRDRAGVNLVTQGTGHILVVVTTLLAVFPVDIEATGEDSRARSRFSVRTDDLEIHNGAVAIDTLVTACGQNGHDVVRTWHRDLDLRHRRGQGDAEGFDQHFGLIAIDISQVIADRGRVRVIRKTSNIETRLQTRRFRTKAFGIGEISQGLRGTKTVKGVRAAANADKVIATSHTFAGAHLIGPLGNRAHVVKIAGTAQLIGVVGTDTGIELDHCQRRTVIVIVQRISPTRCCREVVDERTVVSIEVGIGRGPSEVAQTLQIHLCLWVTPVGATAVIKVIQTPRAIVCVVIDARI